MKSAHSASEIAHYLLWRVAQEQPEDPDYLTPLKLQKLLYFAQGWHLAELGSPLFGDPIRAWREGPVVRAVYAEYREFGNKPILNAPAQPPHLADASRALVESVWARYKRFSAFELSDMTHKEQPWIDARGSLPRSDPSDTLMSLPAIRSEFSAKRNRVQERLEECAGTIRDHARQNTLRKAPWLARPAS